MTELSHEKSSDSAISSTLLILEIMNLSCFQFQTAKIELKERSLLTIFMALVHLHVVSCGFYKRFTSGRNSGLDEDIWCLWVGCSLKSLSSLYSQYLDTDLK